MIEREAVFQCDIGVRWKLGSVVITNIVKGKDITVLLLLPSEFNLTRIYKFIFLESVIFFVDI